MIKPRRIGHVVIKVRDLERAERFYTQVLGFQVSGRWGDRMLFLTATGENHHDLALAAVRPDARTPGWDHVGMYHFAIQVDDAAALRHARDALVQANALTGQSDHLVSWSLYAVDPDGNEFEVYCDVPRERWEHLPNPLGERPRPLDLDAEPGQ